MWIEKIEDKDFKLTGMDPEVRWVNFRTRAIVVIYHEGSISRLRSGLWSRVRVLETKPHNGGDETRSVCDVPEEFIYPVTILPPNR